MPERGLPGIVAGCYLDFAACRYETKPGELEMGADFYWIVGVSLAIAFLLVFLGKHQEKKKDN